MEYLYETHFHTSEVSPCGNVPAAEGVRLYKNAGYSGVLVTDHFATRYLKNNFKGDTWKEKVDSYLNGYHIAKSEETSDFAVMLGLEVRFDENNNDYLLFGATEKFIYDNEDFHKLGIKEFKSLADKNEIAIVQAHPFRTEMTVTSPRYLDGIEVFNGNRRHDSSNCIADAWAQRYELIKTSGSDFHEYEDLARGGIIIDTFVNDSRDLRKMLLKGDYKLK